MPKNTTIGIGQKSQYSISYISKVQTFFEKLLLDYLLLPTIAMENSIHFFGAFRKGNVTRLTRCVIKRVAALLRYFALSQSISTFTMLTYLLRVSKLYLLVYISLTLLQGAFNDYVNNFGQVGGQSIVYVHNIEGTFLFTKVVYQGWVGGQKKVKILFT